MNLTEEERKAAKENYNEKLKITRRRFMADLPLAVAAGGAGLGAAYYQYKKIEQPLKIGIIGTGDEGNVLIGALNPDFVDVVAIADIRPSSIHRAIHGDWPSEKMQPARPGLINVYGKKKGWKTEEDVRRDVKIYTNGWDDLLDDENVEAVIIALPLWLHRDAANDAMLKGKHVLTEKLMAHSVAECKEMARLAEEKGLLLATGHQRHYSVLYANAVATLRQGIIGDIHHIRAQWHRAADTWRPAMHEGSMTPQEFVEQKKSLERVAKGIEEDIKSGKLSKEDGKTQLNEAKARVKAFDAAHPLLSKWASVSGRVNDPKITGTAREGWVKCLAQLEKMIEDATVDAAAYGYEPHVVEESGYKCTPLEELIRWRLWNRTGGGLMAELGSHQLDASGIFIASQFKEGTKVHPISVTGVGGRHLYEANRDIDDHVYCLFEYPGKGYYDDDDPSKNVKDENKKVVVTYSSINGNGFGNYGEIVMGTDGTLILEGEKETMLIGGKSSTALAMAADATVDSYETGGGAAVAAEVPTEDVSRGYTEEIEHWAWCIRNKKDPSVLHCPPKVAMADAIIALVSNMAMEKQERIVFKEEWFDPASDETPEGNVPRKAAEITLSGKGKPQGMA
jgi:predicted dehydrogenase